MSFTLIMTNHNSLFPTVDHLYLISIPQLLLFLIILLIFQIHLYLTHLILLLTIHCILILMHLA